MTARRGQCAACNRSVALRKDGTTGSHSRNQAACKGTGMPPLPFDPNNCPACMMHRFATPGLTEACFSVAIETRKTCEALMWDYLTSYHEKGHADD